MLKTKLLIYFEF